MLRRRYVGIPTKTIVGLIAAAAFAVTVPAAPARAQGLFEFLFRGFRVPPPPRIDSPSDLFRSLFEGNRRPESVRSSTGPVAAYCVRLCDGRYFPIQAQRNISAAAQCRTSCPASETKIFAGGGIEHAVASNGTRYADLANAFVYRQRMVPGCTCNGRTNESLAQIPIADDPTLRPGDIVATNSGLTIYNGRSRHQEAAFTPIDSAKMSKSMRARLADVKVAPQPRAAGDKPVSVARSATLGTTGSAPADDDVINARGP